MLDYKDYYMLSLLSHSYQPLSVDDLSRMVGVSRRSIYYSLNKINDFLESHDIPKIENHRDEGLSLFDDTKSFFKYDMHQDLSEVYVYTQKERIAIEIVLFLINQKQLGIIDFEELFLVSRNTVLSDMKELRKEIIRFHLTLEYDNGNGYYIAGSPIRTRSVLLYIYSSYTYLFKINRFDLYDEELVDTVLMKFKEIEEALSVSYVIETKETLAKMLATVKKNTLNPIIFQEEDKKILEESLEFMIVKQFFSDLFDVEEIHYITLHLMGLRVHTSHELESQDDAYIKKLVNFMVKRFKDLTLIDLQDEQVLCEGLYFHMKSALIRYKYGIIYENELKEDLKEQYKAIYQISERIAKEMEDMIGHPINENDIAYMAMHFGAHLKRERSELTFPKVLLVCLNGVATSKMLRKELEFLLEHIEIIDAVSLDEVEVYADQVDYIITTIPLDLKDYEQKTIFVSPLLTSIDRDRLYKIFNNVHQGMEFEVLKKNIVEKLEKNYSHELAKDVWHIIEKEFQKKSNKLQFVRGKDQPMLNEVITEDKILFKDHVKDYKEAIYESGKPLLDEGIIEERYLEKVISNIHEMGPYIVVAPNIAISHARPEDGVHELGMSMLMLNEAVNFSEDKDRYVKLVVTLAAPDEESHLKALGQLSELFMNSMEEIMNCKTKDDVLKLINQYSI
ncbi:MAG: BglG family transcription antiterminator [Candidatus Izemoplasmataceae bacterium]